MQTLQSNHMGGVKTHNKLKNYTSPQVTVLFACTPSQINIAILIKGDSRLQQLLTVSNYIKPFSDTLHAELKGLNRYEKKKKKKKKRERESES